MIDIERIPASPPHIPPLDMQGGRPLWSVMIPAYNCIKYLEPALVSVLEQDPGVQLMQIEVVDDASTDGDVEELVRRLGKGRVGYYRQERNVGSLRNFETCLLRAKGQLIHLLHGDDMVKPWFYRDMQRLFEANPEAGAAFCKNSFMDAKGIETIFNTTLMDHDGILPDWLERICVENLCQTPAVVVKRSTYEHLGGFFAAHYGEDWEMWCRIAAHYPVAYTPKCMAAYRNHRENISYLWHSSGRSISDVERLMDIIHSYLPESKRQSVRVKAKRKYSIMVAKVARHYFSDRPRQYFELSLRALLISFNFKSFAFFLEMIYRVIASSISAMFRSSGTKKHYLVV